MLASAFRNITSWLLVLLVAFGMTNGAVAASIAPSADLECKVDIFGPIERGDFEKLAALEAHLVIENGESTSGSVVCLDSPGGNVNAGLKMAEFFLEKGVSTRIREDAECYSVCAIMFMMGSYRGDEVAGLSRRMHASAQLGFHRPYLSLAEAGEFTSGQIEASYEFGIVSIFEILTLANRREPWGTAQMIEPDLISRMIGTPGHEMFVITTIEEALRWRIGIDGLPDPQKIGAAHILFACENALALGHSLTTELAGEGLLTSQIFGLSPLRPYSVKHALNEIEWQKNKGVYRVNSLRSGYSAVGCEVGLDETLVKVCGHDEATDVSIGACGEEYGYRYFSKLLLYHPATQLQALTLVRGNAPDAAKLRRCKVFDSAGNSLDNDPCLQEVVLVSEGSQRLARHLFTWPSGARTVVEVDPVGAQGVGMYRINGAAATPITSLLGADCILSDTTGNTFCLSD